MPKKIAGFTLVELLVVISIISLLLVVGLVVYTKVLQDARDSKRKTDLSFIQSALEAYFSDQFYYPLLGTGACPGTDDGKFRIDCPLRNDGGTKTYMPLVPKDPISSPTNQYRYVAMPSGCDNISTNRCNSYCLHADLENAGNSVMNAACTDISGYDLEVTAP